jgi:hypothetical protein
MVNFHYLQCILGNNLTYNAKSWCICLMNTPKHWRCQWQICENMCNNNGIWKKRQQSIFFSNFRLRFWVYVDLLDSDWKFVFTWKYERTFSSDWAICFSIRVCTNSHTLQQIMDNDHTRVEKTLNTTIKFLRSRFFWIIIEDVDMKLLLLWPWF